MLSPSISMPFVREQGVEQRRAVERRLGGCRTSLRAASAAAAACAASASARVWRSAAAAQLESRPRIDASGCDGLEFERLERLVGGLDRARVTRHLVVGGYDAGALQGDHDRGRIAERLVDEQVGDRADVGSTTTLLGAVRGRCSSAAVGIATGAGPGPSVSSGPPSAVPVFGRQQLGEGLVGGAPFSDAREQVVVGAVDGAQAPGHVVGGDGAAAGPVTAACPAHRWLNRAHAPRRS